MSAEATRPVPMPPITNRRLTRMRFLSRLLDNSILLPGGYRIGLDPIIGLVPAIGDFFSTTLSMWLIYDAARLGLPKRVLARMGLNVIVEGAICAVPVLGDLVDAVWKANARNMLLVEAAYKPDMKPRSFMGIALTMLLILLAIYAVLFSAVYLVVKTILSPFG